MSKKKRKNRITTEYDPHTEMFRQVETVFLPGDEELFADHERRRNDPWGLWRNVINDSRIGSRIRAEREPRFRNLEELRSLWSPHEEGD